MNEVEKILIKYRLENGAVLIDLAIPELNTLIEKKEREAHHAGGREMHEHLLKDTDNIRKEAVEGFKKVMNRNIQRAFHESQTMSYNEKADTWVETMDIEKFNHILM